MFFQPTIEIEAAVRNGSLDIGLFGAEAILEKSNAEEMLADLTRRLVEAAEGV